MGPGLWPGPRRQARWAGRGLRRSRAGPEDRFCEAVRNDLRVPLTLEGQPGQCAAFRHRRCDIFTAPGAPGAEADHLVVVLARAATRYGRDRRRPVTGVPCAGCRRAVGLASEGRGERPAPQRRDPRLNPGRLRPVTLAAHPLSVARVRPLLFTAKAAGPARRRCSLDDREDNSHNIDMWAVGSGGGASAAATRASRIWPRSCGWSGRRRCPTHRRWRERCLVRGAGSDRSFPDSRGRRCLGLRSERDGLG